MSQINRIRIASDRKKIVVSLLAAASLTAACAVSAQQGEKPGAAAARSTIANWPKTSKEVATKMIGQYGPPHAVHDSHLYWDKTGPWKYTLSGTGAAQLSHEA